jgi:hypothetical protein
MIMRRPVEGSEEALCRMKMIAWGWRGGGCECCGHQSRRERLVTCSPRELLPQQELPPAE